MKFLRTPDECFAGLQDYAFKPNYRDVDDTEGGNLRMHYVDEGPVGANPVLLMHGEPTWSYLYRHMIPMFSQAGKRVVAPDLIGFGRSDKPTKREDYTYQRHVDWMTDWLKQMDLKDITLFCQDWGGLIGLRLVAAMPERFARVVVANTALPTGDQPMGPAFRAWREFS
ncbi:MAG: haloalkane dehalogenase, partial [Paracoccaceae bacterium]|nr:haloalkane dehalogenase [Paracoccaceae bacterium]